MRQYTENGFTLGEILLTTILMGVIAIFVIPKLVSPNEDRQANILIQKSFTAIGELYLARETDSDTAYPAQNIGSGTENKVFAQYLYDHLNYLSAVDPTGVTAVQYCSTDADYFTLPLGVKVRSICDIVAGGPTSIQVKIQYPVQNNTSTQEYTLVIPEKASNNGEGEERYTTLYGYTNAIADCKPNIDPILHTVATCP